MAVFRVEHTRDFTVMSNHHLRDVNLSLKAKGLLSMMLSLPENWNYSVRGLAAICREGADAVNSALRELMAAGYVVRRMLREPSGRIYDTEYTIYEQPPQIPDPALPHLENPDPALPDSEPPAELKTEQSNTDEINTDLWSIDSLPFGAEPPEPEEWEWTAANQLENMRRQILDDVEYDCLCRQFPTRREILDELVELVVETVCARRKTTRIAGSVFPHQTVRSRFLQLNRFHLEFVMDCLEKNTTAVRNMKQYLLTALFNAPTTMESYYAARVAHDFAAEGYSPGGACGTGPGK